MKTDRKTPARADRRRRRLVWRKFLPFTVLSVLLSGCASSSLSPNVRMVPYSPEQMQARDQAKTARYRVRSGDILKLMFQYETDLDQNNVLVLPDGYITLPAVGSVRAAGLTVPELTDRLVELYGREYRNPDLSVLLSEISDPEVYVLGNVVRPGLYRLPRQGMGVMQAVAAAGGFSNAAEKSSTAVLRAAEDGFVVRTYDLSHIEEQGIMDLSYFDMQPYDIIYVPQSKLGNIDYVTNSLFGSVKSLSDFFWDIYALSNIDKIDRLVR